MSRKPKITAALATALVVAFAACSGVDSDSLTAPEAPAFANNTNVKFTFNDVALPDGTTGEITAGSKTNEKKGTTYTECSYFTDDFREYLGQVLSNDFATTDRDALLTFCLEQFGNRTL